MFTFLKTVKVTNMKNVLVQVPRAVVAEWDLQVGDTLEVTYDGEALTVNPTVQRRSDTTTKSD